MASSPNRSTRNFELPLLREVAASVERELFANVGIRTGIVWRGERQHYLRQNTNRPFEAFTVPVTIQDPGPMARSARHDDGPAIAATTCRPRSCELPQVNIVRNVPNADSSLLDVGYHGDQALQQTMVAGGRVRTHLEPRSNKRIFWPGPPTEHLSAHAERPDQRGPRRTLRVPDLVGQDSTVRTKVHGICG